MYSYQQPLLLDDERGTENRGAWIASLRCAKPSTASLKATHWRFISFWRTLTFSAPASSSRAQPERICRDADIFLSILHRSTTQGIGSDTSGITLYDFRFLLRVINLVLALVGVAMMFYAAHMYLSVRKESGIQGFPW